MASPLQWLPPLATTGIGSLPYSPERAAQVALEHDLPFLPQGAMIAAALEGLPGAVGDGTVDVDRWRRKRDPFDFALDQALASKQLQAFEPAGLAPFLMEVARRRLPLAKVQLAGPGTVRAAVKTEQPELEQQISRLLLARALALVAAVQRVQATPVLFFDEPALIAGPPDAELRALIAATKAAGAVVGLHCCGNADWGAVLGLGLDVLSIDARLSLDALLEENVRGFLEGGGTIALGAVPTNPSEVYVLSELVDSIDTALRSTGLAAFLPRMLITPACGLGLRSVEDADRILAEVREAQRGLSR